MTYQPPVATKLLSPDAITRKVVVALEVFDPLSQTLVSDGLSVTAAGLGMPIVNLSGRFVWTDVNGVWPNQIAVDPINLPYVGEAVAPPAPPDPLNVTADQRRVRIVLRPTPASDFSSGVTAICGQLFETTTAPSAVAKDATTQLAWFDTESKAWVTSPERSSPPSAKGEFAVFIRLQPTLMQEPDLSNGRLKVRLQVTRGTTTRATPDNFPFLTDPQASGRVPEGALLSNAVKLGWAELIAT